MALEKLKDLQNVMTIVLLHVVTRGETHDEIQTLVTEAKEKLHEISKQFDPDRIEVSSHVRIGNPVEEILRVVDEEQAGMIFMSSYGEGSIRTILLGSTTLRSGSESELSRIDHPAKTRIIDSQAWYTENLDILNHQRFLLQGRFPICSVITNQCLQMVQYCWSDVTISG